MTGVVEVVGGDAVDVVHIAPDGLPCFGRQPVDRKPLHRQAALVPWLMAVNFILSALTRRMTWRGITYELRSPWQTVIVERSSR